MNRLHVNKITSIGAVEEGDNPEAHILLYKTKPPVLSADFELEKDESRETVETEGAEMPEVEETVDEAPTEELEKTRVELEKTLGDLEKARAELEEKDAELEEKDAELVKERQERRNVEWLTKAETLKTVLGDPDEWAPILDTLDAAAPEATGQLLERLTVLKEQFDSADIFKELGRQEGARTVEALVKSKQETNPELSEAEARAQVWLENPDLVAEARTEGSHS